MSADIIKFPANEEDELVRLDLEVPRWVAEEILEVIRSLNEESAR